MKAVIQRVSHAGVSVEHSVIGTIRSGLLVLLGIGVGDTEEDASKLIAKILKLRIFDDENGKMNRSAVDINGEILLVSQFTLYAQCQKGNRPSFTGAMPPEDARALYHKTVEMCKQSGLNVQTGEFGKMMEISLVNDGPVTILLDSSDL